MKKILLFGFLLLSFSITVVGQQTITGSIVHDGEVRNYRLFLPSGYSPDTPIPLVFNLHGYTSNAEEQQGYSQMDAVAETETFLVCYADGIGNAWNVGWAFGSTADDVGFISQLIDNFSVTHNVNPLKVYSCGMSNGGFMSYRLACELNNKIAAIASVTGSIAPNMLTACNPGRAVPIMEIHGTADGVVPYGGQIGLCTDIDELMDFWAENNSCNLVGDTTAIPNTNLLDASTATRIDFNECENNAQVSLIKINSGGHTWPGSPVIIGVTNQDIDASTEIWEFFNQHQLDGATNIEEENENNNLVIYPNPASNVLHINTDNYFLEDSYEIYDLNGRTFMSGVLSNSINISPLLPGIYFINVINGANGKHSMFVKK